MSGSLLVNRARCGVPLRYGLIRAALPSSSLTVDPDVHYDDLGYAEFRSRRNEHYGLAHDGRACPVHGGESASSVRGCAHGEHIIRCARLECSMAHYRPLRATGVYLLTCVVIFRQIYHRRRLRARRLSTPQLSITLFTLGMLAVTTGWYITSAYYGSLLLGGGLLRLSSTEMGAQLGMCTPAPIAREVFKNLQILGADGLLVCLSYERVSSVLTSCVALANIHCVGQELADDHPSPCGLPRRAG
jgi:hypothetical protein